MARRIKDYNEEYVNNLTPGGIFLRVLGVIVVLGIIFTILGFGFGWFNKAVDVVGPKNTEAQYTAIYQDYQALQKGAQNVCDLRSARDAATSDDEKSQRVSQVLASQQLFNRNAADYDSRWQNAFQAKYVGPHDVPTTAPSLSELTTKIDGCPQS
jgi:preprotein translocase subunit SecF